MRRPLPIAAPPARPRWPVGHAPARKKRGSGGRVCKGGGGEGGGQHRPGLGRPVLRQIEVGQCHGDMRPGGTVLPGIGVAQQVCGAQQVILRPGRIAPVQPQQGASDPGGDQDMRGKARRRVFDRPDKCPVKGIGRIGQPPGIAIDLRERTKHPLCLHHVTP